MLENRLPSIAFALALLTSSAVAVAASVDDELSALRPDGRSLTVQSLELQRDAFRFQFEEGTFHFLAPVAERTVGAVFVGRGRFELTPASESERQHLALVLGAPGTEGLDDRFSELVLLFGDDTGQEVQLAGPVQTGSPATEAVAAWERHRQAAERLHPTRFDLRLLPDLLDRPGMLSGVFLAFFDGESLPAALAAVDPRGVGALGLEGLASDEDSLFFALDGDRSGAWYVSHRRGEVTSGRVMATKRPTDVDHYRVESGISGDRLDGTTIATLTITSGPLRALPFHLAPSLRISTAEVSADEGTGWETVDVLRGGHGEAYAVLPAAAETKDSLRFRFGYSGSGVLEDLGGDNFVVRPGTHWYPRLGTGEDAATMELVFRTPQEVEVVATGRGDGQRGPAGGTSTFRSEQPVRAAGFLLGKFRRHNQKDEVAQLSIDVFTGPGTPDVVREMNQRIQDAQGTSLVSGLSAAAQGESGFEPSPGGTGEQLGVDLLGVSTESLAESALLDAINASRVAHTYFGPLDRAGIAITQQSDWTGAQSWPGLIVVPYLAFVQPGLRSQLGVSPAEVDPLLGYRELARQWWGHRVGATTFRDAWITEGFAELSAGLVLQIASGPDAYLAQVESWRRAVTRRHADGRASFELGPMVQGSRLDLDGYPGAHHDLVRAKGAFVLHMLRTMMWDAEAENHDHRFIALMQDFATRWAHGDASTAEFQKLVEQHMVPEMNATGDGKMDWFFDQWVRGTDMPRYRHDVEVDKAGGRKYRIHGTVEQLDVPESFRALVPVYIDLGKAGAARIGVIPMVGVASSPIDLTLELPKRPKAVVLNARQEVLARN